MEIYGFQVKLSFQSFGIENNFKKSKFMDDGIAKLSSDGEILFEKSVSQIFIDNGLEYLLFSVGGRASRMILFTLMIYSQ